MRRLWGIPRAGTCRCHDPLVLALPERLANEYYDTVDFAFTSLK